MMNKKLEPRRVRDLVRVLEELTGLHEQLAETMEQKIAAMKRADLIVLTQMTDQEKELAGRITERDGLRRQILDVLGTQMGLPSKAARALTAGELGAAASQPEREALGQARDGLRPVLDRVARLNRLAFAVSRAILSHLEWVFSAVKPRVSSPVGYAGDGGAVGLSGTQVLDAVG